MTVTITPQRITVTDASQNVKFDTDENLFFATDFLTGSLNIPQRSNPNFVQYTHNVASCHAAATKVVGVIRLQVSNFNAGIPGYGWFNAGGTYLHYLDGSYGTQTHEHGNVSRMSTYTFYCEGGQLKCRETAQLYNVDPWTGTQFFVQKAFTLHYRIWCGLFDN